MTEDNCEFPVLSVSAPSVERFPLRARSDQLSALTAESIQRVLDTCLLIEQSLSSPPPAIGKKTTPTSNDDLVQALQSDIPEFSSLSKSLLSQSELKSITDEQLPCAPIFKRQTSCRRRVHHVR